MGHLQPRTGDTYYHRGWWYADEEEFHETAAEYREQELRDELAEYEDPDEDEEEEDEEGE